MVNWIKPFYKDVENLKRNSFDVYWIIPERPWNVAPSSSST